MLDEQEQDQTSTTATDSAGAATDVKQDRAPRTRRRAVSRPAGPPRAAEAETTSAASPQASDAQSSEPDPPKAPRKRTTRRTTRQTPASKPDEAEADPGSDATTATDNGTATTTATGTTGPAEGATPTTEDAAAPAGSAAKSESSAEPAGPTAPTRSAPFAAPLFKAPEPTEPAAAAAHDHDEATDDAEDGEQHHPDRDQGREQTDDEPPRRRRRRGGRRRRKSSDDEDGSSDRDHDSTGASGHGATSDSAGTDSASSDHDPSADGADGDSTDGDSTDGDSAEADSGDGGSGRRRRRRRRRGDGSSSDSSADTATRERRRAEGEITSVTGSTRLEAKKQRRREGREAGRRRAPIVSEAEFLARRESVNREMVIRQSGETTQIAVLEDEVLVEHYVARESQTSVIGNVYLGRVQNVLPSMEAAFIDIGKGRNAVLYAGEVDWKKLGNGKQRKIEEVLKSGQTVLVQVTKDPIGHKGARLTSQISLAGRFLVYVPSGQTSGISRKLPDTERNRLKGLVKAVLPEDAGVIIRTAAEGATEEQLTRDVTALTARWEDIEKKAGSGGAPKLLYAEPDLTIKVIRDLFNEDFSKLVVEGDDAWDMIDAYVSHVAPDLGERLERWSGSEGKDAFEAYRIDEQIAKGVDRKVWLPSGGSLIIDRTEAMTVVDVNTGKFTGSGGNLEETVTKNNLEAAEEIVRQLRLRDIGGIIVIDFIDMVLESNRDLVLRRLVECLGRDRTRHQVAEVTSLGLVQMTRKRIGTGLLEAFSEVCDHCHGRGVIVHSEPLDPRKREDSGRDHHGRGGSKKGSASSAKSGSGSSSGDGNGTGGDAGTDGSASTDAPQGTSEPGTAEGKAKQSTGRGSSRTSRSRSRKTGSKKADSQVEESQAQESQAEQPQPEQPQPEQAQAEQPESSVAEHGTGTEQAAASDDGSQARSGEPVLTGQGGAP